MGFFDRVSSGASAAGHATLSTGQFAVETGARVLIFPLLVIAAIISIVGLVVLASAKSKTPGIVILMFGLLLGGGVAYAMKVV